MTDPIVQYECRAGRTAEWTATGRERPVFLDEHGRRRRWVRAAGALAGLASALWLGGLIVGPLGFSAMPLVRPPLGAAPAILGGASAAALDRLADAAHAHRRGHAVLVAQRHGPRTPTRLALASRTGRSAFERRS